MVRPVPPSSQDSAAATAGFVAAVAQCSYFEAAVPAWAAAVSDLMRLDLVIAALAVIVSAVPASTDPLLVYYSHSCCPVAVS